LSGIRTHNPSVGAGEDISCLIPRGHCDQRESFRLSYLPSLSRAGLFEQLTCVNEFIGSATTCILTFRFEVPISCPACAKSDVI
jgi:hypothetical protein